MKLVIVQKKSSPRSVARWLEQLSMGAARNLWGVRLMEMSTVLCFCAWQRAAKEQRAQPITSRSKQACLVRLRHWSESSPKVMKLSNRFLSLHITFSLVYHSRWRTRVCSVHLDFIDIYTHAHRRANRKTFPCFDKQLIQSIFSLSRLI